MLPRYIGSTAVTISCATSEKNVATTMPITPRVIHPCVVAFESGA